MQTNPPDPPRDPQFEELIDRWPDLSADQKTEIARRSADAIRRRLWETIRDVGPLTTASLASRLKLPEELVAKFCGQLRATGYLRAVRAPDPFSNDGDIATTFDACRRYDPDEFQRRAEKLQREAAQHHEQPAATSPPPAKPQPAPPAHRNSSTSQAAAASIAGCSKSQRRTIVAYLQQHRDASRGELADATGIPEKSVCPRIGELLKAGVVRVAKRQRKSAAGRAVEVLELTGQTLLF